MLVFFLGLLTGVLICLMAIRDNLIECVVRNTVLAIQEEMGGFLDYEMMDEEQEVSL